MKWDDHYVADTGKGHESDLRETTGSLELSVYDPQIFKEKLIHQMHELHLNPKDNEVS